MVDLEAMGQWELVVRPTGAWVGLAASMVVMGQTGLLRPLVGLGLDLAVGQVVSYPMALEEGVSEPQAGVAGVEQ
jgi:hypothetical protein